MNLDYTNQDVMDHFYREILQIAADALALRYDLKHSALYWHDDIKFACKATIPFEQIKKPDGENTFSLSDSMINAVRKPLIILKKQDHKKSYLLFVIPLYQQDHKQGVLAFWGVPETSPIGETDRKLLDVLGLISSRIITGLKDGVLMQPTNINNKAQMPTDGKASSIDIGPTGEDLTDMGDKVAIDNLTTDKSSISADIVPDSQDEILEEVIEIDPLHKEGEQSNISDLEPSEEPIVEENEVEVEKTDFSNELAEINEKLAEAESLNKIQSDSLQLFLASSGLGFLCFDNDCNILTDNVLTTIDFFQEPLNGKNALDVLFKWGTPANIDSASFEKDPDFNMIRELMVSVFSRITDLDVLKELLPAEIICDKQTYELTYHYVKSEVSKEQDNVLVVFNDVSQEKKLASQFAIEAERANMIIKVALDVDGYYQFRQSSEETFDSINKELSKPLQEIQLKKILHNIQAVQGGAEIYEINEITQLSDKIVTRLEEMLNQSDNILEEHLSALIQEFTALEDTFQLLQTQYLNNLVSDEQLLDKTIYRVTKTKIAHIQKDIIENVIQKSMKELEGVFEKNYKPFTRLKSLEEITHKRMDRIKAYIWNNVVDPSSKNIEVLLAGLKQQPVGLILKRYAIIAVNLGERQKKRVEVELTGAEIEVPLHTLESLFSSLTYVIRNSVEHGLETMEERIALNKSLEGKISIKAILEDGMLTISISDDGRGIDVEQIKKSALKNSIISETEANSISESDILQLLFNKGFSTKKDIGGTFGRGVGLSAVGGIVNELGGTIYIETKKRKGTQSTFSIPLQM